MNYAPVFSGIILAAVVVAQLFIMQRSRMISPQQFAAAVEQKNRQAARQVDRQNTMEAIVGLREALRSLSPDTIHKIIESFDKLPVLIEGLEKMCQHSAAQTDVLLKAVELLQSSMSPGEGKGYEELAEETPAAIRVAEQQEIRQLVRQGIPEPEAMRRVKERRIYEGLSR